MAEGRLKFHELSEYKSPGKILIYNYYQYDDKYYHNAKELTRHGTKNDIQKLSQQFIDLDFDVQLCNDLTKDELLDNIETFALPHTPINASKYGCSIVIVLTHGRERGYLSAYDQEFHISEIWEPFKNCAHLDGKPKIFIFQACRSKDDDLLRHTNSDVTNEASNTNDVTDFDIQPDSGYSLTLPHAPDFLVAYSTVEGKESYRDISSGSWYIKALTQELPGLKKGHDVLSILTKVHNRVIRDNRNCGTISVKNKLQQTPIYVSFLNKLVVLKKGGVHDEPSTSTIPTIQRDDFVMETDESRSDSNSDSEDPDDSSYRDEYVMRHERRGTALILRDKQHNKLSREFTSKLSTMGFSNIKSELCDSPHDIVEHIKKNSQNHDDCFLIALLLQLDPDPKSDINDNKICKTVMDLLSPKQRTNLKGSPKICFIMECPEKISRRDSSSATETEPHYGVQKLLATEHSDFLFVKAYSKDVVHNIKDRLGQLSSTDLVSWLTSCLDSQSRGRVSHIESSLRYKIYFRKQTTAVMQEQLEHGLTLKSSSNTDLSYKTALDGPVSTFFHRSKELIELGNQITKGNGENSINIAITGPPGIGKTVTAKKFIFQEKQKFHSYIWWIFAATKICIIESLLKICNDYKIEKNTDSTIRIEQLYTKVASENSTTKQFLVFDNVESYSDIKSYLPPFYMKDKFFIVVTSIENHCPCNYQLQLVPFSREESIETMKEFGINKSDSRKLYKNLGGNPLVITVASRFMKKDPTYNAKNLPVEDIIVQDMSELDINYNKRIANMFDHLLEKVEKNTGKSATLHSVLYILGKVDGSITTKDMKPFFKNHDEMMKVLDALKDEGLIQIKETKVSKATAIQNKLFEQKPINNNITILPLYYSLFNVKCQKNTETILEHIIIDLINNLEQNKDTVFRTKRKTAAHIIKLLLPEILKYNSITHYLPSLLIKLYNTKLKENEYILKFIDDHLTEIILNLYNETIQVSSKVTSSTKISSFKLPLNKLIDAWYALFAISRLERHVNKILPKENESVMNKAVPDMQEIGNLISKFESTFQQEKKVNNLDADSILSEIMVALLKILMELEKYEEISLIYKGISTTPTSSDKITAVIKSKMLNMLAKTLKNIDYNIENDLSEIETQLKMIDCISDEYIAEKLWERIVYFILMDLQHEDIIEKLFKLATVWYNEDIIEVKVLNSILCLLKQNQDNNISDNILHNKLMENFIHHLPQMETRINGIEWIAQQPVHLMLYLVAEHCTLEVVKYIANKYRNERHEHFMTSRKVFGSTVLNMAARGGNLDTIIYLTTDENIDVNERDIEGYTILHTAARFGHLPIVKWFVRNCIIDSNENRKNDINISLLLATRNGYLNVIEWLVKNADADLRCKYRNKATIMHIAAQEGHLHIIKWLKNHSKNDQFLLDASEFDSFGDLPINSACWGNKLEIVEWFLKNTQVDINKQDEYGGTLLRSSVWKGYLDMVKWLIKNGADITLKDKWENSILHKAAQAGHIDILKWLYENEKIIDIKSKNKEGWTALHLASHNGHVKVVDWLVDHLDVNDVTNKNETALHLACKEGHSLVVARLIQCLNLIISSSNCYDETPLHCATYVGNKDIVDSLINMGANMEHKNIAGETPLHVAVRFNRIELVQNFILKGAIVIEKDNHGDTLIHKAANYCRLEILEWLLKETDIDINEKNSFGSSAICQPLAMGYVKIVELLLKYKAKTDDIEVFDEQFAQLLLKKNISTSIQSIDSD